MASIARKTLLDNLPGELRNLAQWVCVRIEQRGGKFTKVPYCAQDATQRASVTDTRTWVTFEQSVTALETGDCDGVGLVLMPETGLTIVDLDHCIQPDGELTPEAQEVVDRFNSYTEISQSSSDVHIIIRGGLPGKRRRKRGIEMYDRNRYFWLTGNVLGDF